MLDGDFCWKYNEPLEVSMRIISTMVIGLTLVAAAAGVSFAQTPTRMLVPCNYPHGWNSGDASRELQGTPNGDRHQCVVSRSVERNRLDRDAARRQMM